MERLLCCLFLKQIRNTNLFFVDFWKLSQWEQLAVTRILPVGGEEGGHWKTVDTDRNATAR